MLFSDLTFCACILAMGSSSPFSGLVECEVISVCADFVLTTSTSNAEVHKLMKESDIAREGSWDGVVPKLYKLDLVFVNRTNYMGSLNITFKLLKNTHRILINRGTVYPSIDYRSILIRRMCKKTYNQVGPNCIKNITFLEHEETLILYFQGLHLQFDPETEYVLSFPFFQGRSRKAPFSEPTTSGLVESTVKFDKKDLFSCTSTIFQMRYARTVFPCFDHPSLTAQFELCLERPSHVSVASNTAPIQAPFQSLDPNFKRSCFERTPQISTYSFTFALMENYPSESIQAPFDGPLIKVIAPTWRMEYVRWMLSESVPVLQYLERITNFKFPLKNLAFLVAYPSPYWGVENLGLITVDGPHIEEYQYNPDAYMILYHELVHQWLGNVVTISQWREVCLQEGLTAYFDWYLTDMYQRRSLEMKAEYERVKIYEKGAYYEGYAQREWTLTEQVADQCYYRPALFFHTLAEQYGFEILEMFLKQLVERHSYGNANISDWDDIMGRVAEEKMGRSMKGYIKDWFLQPGPLYLYATETPDGCISLRQMVNTSRTGSARLTPLAVQTYGSSPMSYPLSLITQSFADRTFWQILISCSMLIRQCWLSKSTAPARTVVY